MHPEQNPVLRWVRRVVPVTPDYVGGKFIVRQNGLFATPLLLVLIVVGVGALGVVAGATIGPTVGEILFGDKFNLGSRDLTLLFRHTLTPLEDGGTRVTHELEISGDGVDAVGPELGPQISGDFPVTMDELLASARGRSAAAR